MLDCILIHNLWQAGPYGLLLPVLVQIITRPWSTHTQSQILSEAVRISIQVLFNSQHFEVDHITNPITLKKNALLG